MRQEAVHGIPPSVWLKLGEAKYRNLNAKDIRSTSPVAHLAAPHRLLTRTRPTLHHSTPIIVPYIAASPSLITALFICHCYKQKTKEWRLAHHPRRTGGTLDSVHLRSRSEQLRSSTTLLHQFNVKLHAYPQNADAADRDIACPTTHTNHVHPLQQQGRLQYPCVALIRRRFTQWDDIGISFRQPLYHGCKFMVYIVITIVVPHIRP
jgi:hypothetical protein